MNDASYSVNSVQLNKITKDCLSKIKNLEKLVIILTDRIKKIEKDKEINDLVGNLKKHNEQSRRRK